MLEFGDPSSPHLAPETRRWWWWMDLGNHPQINGRTEFRLVNYSCTEIFILDGHAQIKKCSFHILFQSIWTFKSWATEQPFCAPEKKTGACWSHRCSYPIVIVFCPDHIRIDRFFLRCDRLWITTNQPIFCEELNFARIQHIGIYHIWNSD